MKAEQGWPLMMVIGILASICGAPLIGNAAQLSTIAEQSGFKRTGRYAEVERLCRDFQQSWTGKVRCVEFGRTPEGRPMLALVASQDGVLDPNAARKQRRPVVLMQGGIHAGEIDGKDAGFLALRELLSGTAAPDTLRRVTFVFVPVFNVDGHERFGRWNRPNQVGPEEMGWRTTAQNLNLNRDYAKAEAPEMQALLRLLNQWDPILYVDLHVTDGADFQHDVSYNVTPTLAGPAALMVVANQLREALLTRMTQLGSLPLDFYPSFIRDDDPTSGFAVSVAPARFSQQYWTEHNRLGVLVETHSWKDYATRVRSTRNSIVTLLERAAVDGAQWLRAAQEADQQARQLGGQELVLAYDNNEHVTQFDFRGYAYVREPSPISGALVTRYDPSQPQVWRVPLRDQVRPTLSVTLPRGGYVVPAAHAGWVAEKLGVHGIQSRRLAQPVALEAEVMRATRVTRPAGTFEGRSTVQIEGSWTLEQQRLPAGSLFVPIAQPNARVLAKLLEPQDPDSFVSWGFFNAAFERKEYMEAYVTEMQASEMLAKDPQLKAEFLRKLSEEPEFARSPAARLDFFYRRTPAWDTSFNLYPVVRVATAPQ
jgi:Zinc carboxypeptidase